MTGRALPRRVEGLQVWPPSVSRPLVDSPSDLQTTWCPGCWETYACPTPCVDSAPDAMDAYELRWAWLLDELRAHTDQCVPFVLLRTDRVTVEAV